MRVELFDFDLPDDLIAQRPASPRDSARLLDVSPDGLRDRLVRDLPGLLSRGDKGIECGIVRLSGSPQRANANGLECLMTPGAAITTASCVRPATKLRRSTS